MLLSVRDLKVAFAGDEGVVQAVDGVSFDIPRHATVALVGESGSGKTVVSSTVLGILPRNARVQGGSILFQDPDGSGEAIDLLRHDQDSAIRRRIRGDRISIIFQEPMSSLSPVHTIGDQIGEAYRLHVNSSQEAARRETVAMLSRVGFPDPERAFDAYPFELSGGLRQRAMIAMALICRPALLIADEPTTALDVTIQAQILKLINDLKEEIGMSVLFITHDLGVVANMASDVIVMYRGRVVERGSCARLIRQPEHPYLKALMQAVPRLHMAPGERLEALRPAAVSVGEAKKTIRRPISHRTDADILEVKGLRKHFALRSQAWVRTKPRWIKAVEDVSFTVKRGESFAIVGESGSGKTTVSKLLMRGLQPDAGSIVFRDDDGEVDVLALDEHQLLGFRRKMQYMFQDPFGSLNPRMTVLDIVTEPLVIHGIGSREERVERAKHLLGAVGLDRRHLSRYPHSFSGGQRQRIGIARALALEPSLLICDEPVSALDVSIQAQILNLLKDLQADLGLTYIFISHNLAVVRYIAQRIAVMCAGHMVELATTRQIFDNPQHPYTKALLAAVPEPDLDHLLDFSSLVANRASCPEDWPAPYSLAGHSGSFRQVDNEHYVRMQA